MFLVFFVKFPEAVPQNCFLKKLFQKFRKIHRKTCPGVCFVIQLLVGGIQLIADSSNFVQDLRTTVFDVHYWRKELLKAVYHLCYFPLGQKPPLTFFFCKHAHLKNLTFQPKNFVLQAGKNFFSFGEENQIL